MPDLDEGKRETRNNRISKNRATHKADSQERKAQLEGRAAILHEQAQSHMDKAANTGGGITGKLKNLLTFLAPAAVLPQIATLTTATFAPPAAIALGGTALLVRYLANRFDASREHAAARAAEAQAKKFDAEAEETKRLMTNNANVDSLSGENAGLQEQLGTMRGELEAEQARTALLTENKNQLTQKRNELEETKTTAEAALDTLTKELAKKESEMAELKKCLGLAQELQDVNQRQIRVLTEAFMNGKEVAKLHMENATLRGQLQQSDMTSPLTLVRSNSQDSVTSDTQQKGEEAA